MITLEKKETFLSEEKVILLQESIGFLDRWALPKTESCVIKTSSGKLHKEKTEALHRLGHLRLEEKKLLKILMMK